MQKTSKNASILIWSIFLSIIISLGFISISTQINKTLKNNKIIQQNIINENELKNILNSPNPISQSLSDGRYLKISDKKSYISSLEKGEIQSLSFSGTLLDFIQIDIKKGGPIKYSYDIGTVNDQYDILKDGSISFSGNLNNFSTDSILTLENLGGYTLFEVNSDLEFEAPERYYEVWKKIGNKNILIETSKIK